MERHFGKLSISANGLLGNGGDSAAPSYRIQASPRQPSVYVGSGGSGGVGDGGDRGQRHQLNGDDTAGRQRTGRIRQERSSAWGGGGTGGGAARPAEAELAETVDLRLQQESPRTPRTAGSGGGGGSPRYATLAANGSGADDHHLAAISPRGVAAGHQAHSYHRRDRNPSGSGGAMMVTEDDFRHAKEAGAAGGGGDSSGGWQPSRSPNDVSTRLIQKYKTDSLRADNSGGHQQQQRDLQHLGGLSKSHDGFVAPRRLPPIGAAGGVGGHRGDDASDSGEEDDASGCEDDGDGAERGGRRRSPHGGDGSGGLPSLSAAHKGRTRTT